MPKNELAEAAASSAPENAIKDPVRDAWRRFQAELVRESVDEAHARCTFSSRASSSQRWSRVLMVHRLVRVHGLLSFLYLSHSVCVCVGVKCPLNSL